VMQVPTHSITARRLPRVCVSTVGGNPPPGRVRRLPVAVPPLSGVWGGCRVSGQRTAARDLGAAVRGEAELTKRSAASQSGEVAVPEGRRS
jgi:hypothetical protein